MGGERIAGTQRTTRRSAGRALVVVGAALLALLGPLMNAVPASASAPSEWTQPGGSASHRSWNRNEQTLTPSTVSRLRPGWSQSLPSTTEPVVAGGRLFTTEQESG